MTMYCGLCGGSVDTGYLCINNSSHGTWQPKYTGTAGTYPQDITHLLEPIVRSPSHDLHR